MKIASISNWKNNIRYFAELERVMFPYHSRV